MKIVLVGAGSREFGPATIRDVCLSDDLCAQDLDLTLMDVSDAYLPDSRAYAEQVAKQMGRQLSIAATVDLDEALDGADFVVVAIEHRRYFYWAQDFHVPRQFGFRQIYGENGGPGGLFHALRNMTPMLRIARAMEQRCPEAWLLNYTNPLTKLCEALTRLCGIKAVGLCHGVFHGKQQVSRLLDIDAKDIDAKASGLNHITWFQSIHHRSTGEDLYPLLRQRERKAHPLGEWDEMALSRILLRTFGLYPSPGTNHIGEYIQWSGEFLGSTLLQFYYDPAEGHPWDTGRVPTWIYNLHEKATAYPLFDDSNDAVHETEAPLEPSGELAIPIIEGLTGSHPQELDAVNVPNQGYAPGLPEGAIVEVPARADAKGLHPVAMPRLPEPVLALLRTQCSINQLLVEAFAENAYTKLLQALLLDPATHSYRSAASLIPEMLRLQSEVLPNFSPIAPDSYCV